MWPQQPGPCNPLVAGFTPAWCRSWRARCADTAARATPALELPTPPLRRTHRLPQPTHPPTPASGQVRKPRCPLNPPPPPLPCRGDCCVAAVCGSLGSNSEPGSGPGQAGSTRSQLLTPVFRSAPGREPAAAPPHPKRAHLRGRSSTAAANGARRERPLAEKQRSILAPAAVPPPTPSHRSRPLVSKPLVGTRQSRTRSRCGGLSPGSWPGCCCWVSAPAGG